MSERQRQRQRAKEARALFGVKAKVSEPPRAYGRPMHDEMAEERRLATVHDPAKPSACRLCGTTVEPGASEVAGWKVCGPCGPLLPAGLSALLSELVGMTVAPHEAEQLCARMQSDNPAFFVTKWATDPGQPTRWAHVPPDFAEEARWTLEAIRAQGTPRPNSYGTGCAWCGVRTSTAWTQTPWRFGSGREAPRAAVCAGCEPWVARSGARSGYGWHEHLLAACVGMRRGQMGLTFDLKAYCESDPDDRSGTAEPWAYLGALRGQMRLRVARLHPRLISLTEREQRVLALQRVAEDAGKPIAGPTPLARM